eukprot:403332536
MINTGAKLQNNKSPNSRSPLQKCQNNNNIRVPESGKISSDKQSKQNQNSDLKMSLQNQYHSIASISEEGQVSSLISFENSVSNLEQFIRNDETTIREEKASNQFKNQQNLELITEQINKQKQAKSSKNKKQYGKSLVFSPQSADQTIAYQTNKNLQIDPKAANTYTQSMPLQDQNLNINIGQK